MGAHTTYNSYGAFLDVAVGTGVAAAHRGARPGPRRLRPAARRHLALPDPAQGAAGALLAGGGPPLPARHPRRQGRARPSTPTTPACWGGGTTTRSSGRSSRRSPPRRPAASRSPGPARSSRSGSGARSSSAPTASRAGSRRSATARRRPRASPPSWASRWSRSRKTADGLEVRCADGRTFSAPNVALAVPPNVAAALLREPFPELAAQVAAGQDGGGGQRRRGAARRRRPGRPPAPSWCRWTTPSSPA